MIRIFNVYYPIRTILLLMSEMLIVGGSFLLAAVIILGPDTSLVLNYEYGALKIAGVTGLTLLFSYYFDLYEPETISARWEIYFRILLVLGFVSIFLSVLFYLFPSVAIAGYVLPLGFGLLTASLLLWRSAYGWIISRSVFRERIYILGAGDFASNVISTIRSRKDGSIEIVGWDQPSADRAARKESFTSALQGFQGPNPKIDRVVIALEDRRDELPLRELLRLRFDGVIIEEAASLLERYTGKLHLDHLRPSSFIHADGFRIKPSQQILRRIVSTLAAAVGLLLFLPVFPIIVFLIRLSSPGPIFFRQTRVGLRGNPFTVLKFRTMRQDAESAGAQWAARNDPRVTRIGKFMRKSRIDEIPQLWNVLRGDMGFVGPRPERPEFVPLLSQEMPYYHLRHTIRPGLTGWAQVRYGYGGSLEESRHKLEYDLYYLKHMSLGLDLLIMFETIKTVVRRRGGQ